MFPSSEDLTGHPPPQFNLEDRLRGLILNNATPNQMPDTLMQPPPRNNLPPHMQAAGAQEQQEYLASGPIKSHPEPQGSSGPQGQPSQTGRKRLNQAQRRLMNSQLSIPIDSRMSQNAQPIQGHANAQQSWPPQHYNGNPNSQLNPRFPQHSPQFQQPVSPYSPRHIYSQGPQPSPRHQHQHGNQQPFPQQGPSFPQQTRQAANSNPHGTGYARSQPQNWQLFQPGVYNGQGRGRPLIRQDPAELAAQSAHLETLMQESVPEVGIDPDEKAEKEAFRSVVENACREAITDYEQRELGNPNFDPLSVELKCFGSMSSGFATKASDMDLALFTPHSAPPADSPESRIPRILERKLLDLGYGARLLTRTRVPIIKLCEKPTEKLRSDLLEERAKWDNGFNADDEEEREVNPEIDVPMVGPNVDELATSPAPSAVEPVSHKKQVCPEDLLGQLKQKQNQPIVDYYNNAKWTLRRLGTFDLSASSPEPSLEQGKILNNVCKAFVSGLSSEALSTRLRAYASIAPLFDESGEFVQRSLNGIWTQVEGERLAMACEDRPLKESNERRESECLAMVEAWRQLQDKSGPLTESLLYDRQLYLAYERLKSMSSLGLVFLEQTPHEQPTSYAARAQRILDDLKGQYIDAASDPATPIIISHYVSGITNPIIRESMRKFTECRPTFKEVTIQHRALQLAIDYEYALTKDLYIDEDKSKIEQYITWLRDRKNAFSSSDVDPDLLSKICALPDPTSISSNKPRDRYRDHLGFPKTDIGIQCDINFSAHLALHNTLLLRCYAQSDPRVRLLILFVKNWAKVRGINTPYRGTLSSYGYVLMVLHYLVNVAAPFVCPNLQALQKDPPLYPPPAEIEARTTCMGRDVRFWRNETEIKSLADRGMLNHNRDSIGLLLRGFFEFFAQNNQLSTVNCRGFDWGREVLSLRTQGGVLTKQEKGWTGAKTVVETTTIAAPPTPSTPAMKFDSPKDTPGEVARVGDGQATEVKALMLPIKTMEETKEIRHRYLFAIEDPFELDHNVARTVTHNGIVSIRDEFRRAWRIIRNTGKGNGNEGLLDAVSAETDTKNDFKELLTLIHGPSSQAAGNASATH